MRFEKIAPTQRLKPYVKYYAISENAEANTYKVLPSTGLVIGFQYQGQLSTINNSKETILSNAGISGVADTFKIFKNAASIGTILVYFTEVGLASFSTCPANELFNESISLTEIFDKHKISETEEKLYLATSDQSRIKVVEQFLLSQLKEIAQDKLIVNAVKLIYQHKGNIKIKEINEQLSISQSPFEKRFRRLVGVSAKKFSSIVRFNNVLSELSTEKSLSQICYDNNFFDQSHFIKDFKQHTGDTPESFKLF